MNTRGNSETTSSAVTATTEQPDARFVAAMTAVVGIVAGFAPFLITLAAVVFGPYLPYPVGALVSFVLVAACVTVSLVAGIRALKLLRAIARQRPQLPKLRGAAATMPVPVDRALVTIRIAAIAGIVLGCLNGLFLLGSLALNIPGIVWQLSIVR
ncbi:hypothetical protein [Parafrigoribacterium humi]|uniref:hypothetical protein n=1 Tax=Parafrigoribacterium humi TaxID=3144664 RepID=UPI0032EDC4B9